MPLPGCSTIRRTRNCCRSIMTLVSTFLNKQRLNSSLSIFCRVCCRFISGGTSGGVRCHLRLQSGHRPVSGTSSLWRQPEERQLHDHAETGVRTMRIHPHQEPNFPTTCRWYLVFWPIWHVRRNRGHDSHSSPNACCRGWNGSLPPLPPGRIPTGRCWLKRPDCSVLKIVRRCSHAEQFYFYRDALHRSGAINLCNTVPLLL